MKSKLLSKTSKILVIDEGFSAEKEVSLRSGRNVTSSLIKAGYENTKSLHLSSPEDLKKIIDLQMKKEIDIAVLMTHGRFGEDGCIQGFLELLGISYTGSDVKASSNCMNKLTTKALLKDNGLNVFPNLEIDKLLNSKTQENDFPIILKATAEGSSVGVEKISDFTALENKLKAETQLLEELKARTHKRTFIEPYTQGVEVTTSILPFNEELYTELNIDIDSLKLNPNLLIDEDLISLPILKLIPKKEFYDYEAKYTAGLTDFELPASLTEDLTKKVHMEALKAYRTMECSGFARVDFILKPEAESHTPFILELNTLPGMTDTSDLPAQAKCAGIQAEKLVEILINSNI